MVGTNDKMKHVSRKSPCPICQKYNWCLVASDGSAAICQRIKDGSVKRCGDAGYLHILTDRPKNRQYRCQGRFTVDDRPDKDFTSLQQQYSRQITDGRLDILSHRLGVSTESLKRLRTGWDSKAFTFPMTSAEGRVIGIRRRFPNDRKFSVTGSKTGLFIPADLSAEGLLLICEGPTDTAAAIDLGFAAIGRPNCNSKVKMTIEFCKGRSELIIIGDNDKIGRDGAEKLAGKLLLYCSSVKIIYPPDTVKDLRQWLQGGLTSEKLQKIIENTKPLIMELR